MTDSEKIVMEILPGLGKTATSLSIFLKRAYRKGVGETEANSLLKALLVQGYVEKRAEDRDENGEMYYYGHSELGAKMLAHAKVAA